jgi:hypothetical protein
VLDKHTEELGTQGFLLYFAGLIEEERRKILFA